MADLARAAWAFPLVGLVVGVLGALTYGLAALLALPSPVGAILAIATMIVVTGALHEDGLADLFDALGGHAGRERALEIMRDSRIGSYGTLALLVVTAVRITATASLLAPTRVAWALIAAACLSRALMALLMAVQKPARRDGLGAGAGQVTGKQAALASMLGLVALLPLGAPTAMLAGLAAAVVAFLLVERWTRRRLGGFTGDTLGGLQQLCEAACLIGFAAALA